MAIEAPGPGEWPRTHDEQAIASCPKIGWPRSAPRTSLASPAWSPTTPFSCRPAFLLFVAVEAMYRSFFPQCSTVEQTVSVEEVQVAGEWALA
jgi:hypothetical protein